MQEFLDLRYFIKPWIKLRSKNRIIKIQYDIKNSSLGIILILIFLCVNLASCLTFEKSVGCIMSSNMRNDV